MNLYPSAAMPHLFRDTARDVMLELHMDAIRGTGPTDASNHVIRELRTRLDLKDTELASEGRYSHLR